MTQEIWILSPFLRGELGFPFATDPRANVVEEAPWTRTTRLELFSTRSDDVRVMNIADEGARAVMAVIDGLFTRTKRDIFRLVDWATTEIEWRALSAQQSY